MKKITAIGANVYDTLIDAPHYPTEDTKLRVSGVMKCGGGPAATGIAAAAKLGAPCSFIGNMTDDEGGVFLKNDFEKYGVDTKNCTILKGYSSFSSYIILSSEAKTRTCVFDKGNVPALQLTDNQKKAILDSGLLMVDGNEINAAVEAAKLARENGIDVLYDAGGLYDGIEKLLPYTNILIPSYEYATGFTKTDNAEAAAKKLYEAYKPDIIVITDGKNGGYMYNGTEFSSYPAFTVDAVDTNGAGDVFHGAFAFARVSGYDYKKSCVFSSAVSALKCTKIGARMGVPSFYEVSAFLSEKFDNF